MGRAISVVDATIDSSGSVIQAPEIADRGSVRFCTVTGVPEGGVSIHGVTPLSVGDLVVLQTSSDFPEIVIAEEVVAFWHPRGGRIEIECVGDRVMVESGYLANDRGEYAVAVNEGYTSVDQTFSIWREYKLGEHCTLAQVSRGVDLDLVAALGSRCWITWNDYKAQQELTDADRKKGLVGCITSFCLLSLGGRQYIILPTRWLEAVTMRE